MTDDDDDTAQTATAVWVISIVLMTVVIVLGIVIVGAVLKLRRTAAAVRQAAAYSTGTRVAPVEAPVQLTPSNVQVVHMSHSGVVPVNQAPVVQLTPSNVQAPVRIM